MASEVLASAILIIAGIVIAAALATALMTQSSVVSSAMAAFSRASAERLATRVKIVHVTTNATRSWGSHLLIFIKNVGMRGIEASEVARADLYVGGRGVCSALYLYSPTGGLNTWNYRIVDINGDGVWGPGETLVVSLYNSTALVGPLCAKFVLPNGVGDEALLAA